MAEHFNIGGAIDALGISFRQSFKRKVGPGSEIGFWTEKWFDDGPCFNEKFPRLFALESNKNCFLQDRWVSLDGEWRANWEWRIQPRGRTEGDITNLENILNGLALKMDDNDGWIWSLDNNKGFSVNHLSKLIDSRILSPGCLGRVVNWNNWVPRKVNIFNWRVVNDIIPHLSNIYKRGIDVHSLLCPLCDSDIEDSNHILFNCHKVKPMWLKCFDWWNYSVSAHPPSFVSLVSSFFSHNNKWLAKICHGVSLVVLWAIWRWRNRIIHTVSDSRQAVIDEDIFPQIQILSFLWISNRCKRLGFNWSTWISCPWEIVEDLINADISELKFGVEKKLFHQATKLGGLGFGKFFLSWVASFSAMGRWAGVAKCLFDWLLPTSRAHSSIASVQEFIYAEPWYI
ncbi:RNA-directed DNA polymerase, eukaryota, Reverse transcriptase zinc-binding domain protein [Artemisia annua]|uniref:RNA-directed DNA polymerase, eukaryota, Reverse transcriptase zinc-binding domain protein n=1 Tax=Artemisia annua TaxID=35608 RepID=A0A2U1MCN8_ARTAN|nr:RNA-directed DNA polymerase, eukaryota, Reverse transcriptase zinc-binding domain protein [Artemisia annua]